MRNAILILALTSTGCGTIMNGGKQTVDIRSNAYDAEVTVKSDKGPDAYQGPAGKVQLARGEQYTVTVKAAGFRERKVRITHSTSGWMFGNVVWILPIFWGIGVAVDAMSGGLWTLGDDEVNIPLSREAPAPAPAPVSPPTPATEPAPVGNMGY